MGAPLCDICTGISLSTLTAVLENPPPWWSDVDSKPVARGRLFVRHSRYLLDSSKTCHLCELILECLERGLSTKTKPRPKREAATSGSLDPINSHEAVNLTHILGDQPVYLAPKQDNVRTLWPEGCGKGAELRGVSVHVTVGDSEILSGVLRMWAPQDSIARLSGEVAGRPQLLSSSVPEAHLRVSQWLQACISQHQDCNRLLSGRLVEEVEESLPTRVIEIGQGSANIDLRLLETNGARGLYVALSHCWGPSSKRPLRTTTVNLVEFKQAIPWQELPKTFADAVIVTQALGIKYLWIDSLCIVQDDIEDWKREAVKMGTVYEHARLTIAASHAADSHDGIFLNRPALPKSVELPHFDEQGLPAGHFFISQYFTDFDSISPESGPLNTRAWASQECLLSRRMVFYTAQSIMWSCKTITQRETGEICHNTARNPRWKTVVEQYSLRKLTQPGDKLIALEGLKNALTTKLNDEYILGVWRNCMPDQLLWRVRTTRQKRVNVLKLPSWTWASTEVAVRFLDVKGAKNNCAGFQFQDNRVLVTSRCRAVASFTEFSSKTLASTPMPSSHASSRMSTIVAEANSIPADLVMLLRDDVGNPLGWAVFDEPELHSSSLFCLLLMSKMDRKSRDALSPDPSAVFLNKNTDWALILQQEKSHQDCFVRVGVGKVYNSSWWDRIPIRKVCIV